MLQLRKFKGLTWLVILSGSLHPSLSQESGFTIHDAGSWPGYLTGEAQGIFSYGGFLYVQIDVSGGGWGELQGRPGAEKSLAVFDLQDPAKPIRVKNIDGLNLGAPHYFGNYAVPVGGDHGLKIYDFSDPLNPALVPTVPIISGGISGYAMAGTIGYATTFYGPLYVLEMSDPRTPRILRTIPGDFYQLMTTLAIVSGQTLCISVGNNRWGSGAGVWLMDIRAPGNPMSVGKYSRAESYSGIVSSGSRLFARTSDGRLEVIEVSNPASPTLVGTYSNTQIGLMEAAGNRLYVHTATNEVRALDVGNPVRILEVGRYTINTSAPLSAFTTKNQHLYAVMGRGPMTAMDISQPTNSGAPFVFGPASPVMLKVAVHAGRAYVPLHTAGLRILDVRQPSEPKVLGESRECQALGCFVTNGFAYVADLVDGLVILDIKDPSNIIRVGSIPNDRGGRFANDVIVSGRFAYLRSANALEIIDISDPTLPVRTGQWTGGGSSLVYSSLAIAGTRAYLPSQAVLDTVDISNPSEPKLLHRFTTNFLSLTPSIAIKGGVAYLVTGELWILNVSNPSNTAVLARYRDEFRDWKQLVISGDYALVAGCRSGECEFAVIDTVEPGQLRPIARVGGLADGLSLSGEGHYAWVCNRDGGLAAFALNPPGPPAPAALLATRSGSFLRIETRGQPMRQHVVQRNTSFGASHEWLGVATNRSLEGIFVIEEPSDRPGGNYYRVLSE